MNNGSREYGALSIGQHRRLDVEEELRDELKSLAGLVGEISLNGEMERLHIASELMDNIGQTLLLARIKTGMLSLNMNPGEYEDLLEDLRSILDRAVWEIRMLSQRLCPPLLFADGLETSLQWLARDMENNHGLKVAFSDDGSDKPLDGVARSILFQAAQELLVNVARHAGSGAARLAIDRYGEMLRLLVEDRGVGFDPADFNISMAGRTGLFSVRRRVISLGGEMIIRSSPGMGTVVSLMMPLARQ